MNANIVTLLWGNVTIIPITVHLSLDLVRSGTAIHVVVVEILGVEATLCHKLDADGDGSRVGKSVGCVVRPVAVVGHPQGNWQARKVVLASLEVASIIGGNIAQVLDVEEEDVPAGVHIVATGVDCLH